LRSCRRPLVLASVVTVAGFSLLAAGCAGGGSPKAGIASLATTTSPSAAGAATVGGSSPGGELAEYASCMRSHGVLSFPDPASFGSSGAIKAAKGQMAQISERETSSATFQGAQRACARYYGRPATSPSHPSSQEMQKLLAVSRCMRAHGILDFPDPDPTTGELTAPAGISKNSPQVDAALRVCRSLGQAAGLGPPNTGP
jgi:hypothetical protein